MSAKVHLWDPLVRLFHWSLALAFFANYFVTEEGESWHDWLGYYAAMWLLVRCVWGFMAPGAAAWQDFWPTPARLKEHLGALVQRRPYHRLGHSPLGALVMLCMMLAILALAVTGFMMQEIDYFWGEDWLEELHALIADGLAALVCIHVLAAILESIRLRDNLPLSMITGRRKPIGNPAP